MDLQWPHATRELLRSGIFPTWHWMDGDEHVWINIAGSVEVATKNPLPNSQNWFNNQIHWVDFIPPLNFSFFTFNLLPPIF